MSFSDDLIQVLDTPCAVVELTALEHNIKSMAEAMRERGVRLRPHFKTHKSLEIAKMQQRHGASGQTCATFTEAEALADAGIDDIFVAYPVWPAGPKRRRLGDLLERVKLSVGTDSVESTEVLGGVAKQSHGGLDVLIEIDSGGRRSGVRPAEAGRLAVAALRAGLGVRGVFTHGGHSYGLDGVPERAAEQEVAALEAAVKSLSGHGIDAPVVSAGSTPSALLSAVGPVTEERPGTYVFGDRQQLAIGSMRLEQLALSIATTVVSRAVDDQFIVDAGAKCLPRETQPWLTGFGTILQWPDANLDRLYDHHGVGSVSSGQSRPPLGAVLAVAPNHVCPTVNLATELVVIRDDVVVDRWAVVARSPA